VPLKVVIGAVISLTPYSPGMAWNWMQLAIGLRQLGHDVYYIEEVAPEWCVDERGDRCTLDRSVNRRLFRETMERFGFADQAYQIRSDEAPLPDGLEKILAQCPDLLINMAGHIRSPRVLERVQRRVYVDQDPVYTQLWHAEYGSDLNFAAHDIFLSVGLNIGTPECRVPDCDVEWRHILPVVVPDLWTAVGHACSGRFTTVASWGGFGDLCYRGEWYGSKYVEFNRFAELPRRVDQELEVALRRHRADDPRVQRLVDNGWVLSNASTMTTLSSYQEFIARSRAEIGIAKNAYVKARSGWFSDRAAHYLASGRPVLAQSTGVEKWLPTGRGLLAFADMEQAVAGIEEINRDYDAHSRDARDFTAAYLDYRMVIPHMLEICSA
jgi:hypothetical protein